MLPTHPRFIKITIFVFVLLVCLVGGFFAIFRPKFQGLHGEYYNNPTWQGKPYKTSIDPDISTKTLKLQREQFPQNRFSVRWTGYMYIPEMKNHTFMMSSDDGSWLLIDDHLIVDNGGTHGTRQVTGSVSLTKGIHRITIRYFQMEGEFTLNVLWMRDPILKTPIPAKFLLPPDADLKRFRIYQTGKMLFRALIVFCSLVLVAIGIFLIIRRGITALFTQRYTLVVFLFFVLFLLFGLRIFDDYGIAWDEQIQRELGLNNYRYIAGGDKKLVDEYYHDKYYGPVFELLLIFIEHQLRLDDSRNVYLMRHLVTFLVFYTGVFFFYLLCKDHFRDWKIGLLTSLFFIVSPRIFAHSFYNSKDLPFLSIFIISIYTLIKYLDKKTWLRALFHALISALLIDIRILGAIIPCFTFIFVIIDLFLEDNSSISIPKTLATLFQYGLLLIGFTLLGFPILWEGPFYHFIQAFITMKKFPWDGQVLYLGKYIKGNQIPWHYIPVWLLITTPIGYSVYFFVGLFVSGISLLKGLFNACSYRQKRNDLIWLGWFFLPVFSVIMFKSVLYDAWRHLFFVYPAFLIIALNGFIFLFRVITSKFKGRRHIIGWGILVFIVLLSLWGPIYFMVTYHPYQNVYFNRFAGKDMKTVKQKFDLDYWGLSYRKALEYILQNDLRDTITVHVSDLPGKTSLNILQAMERKRVVYVDERDNAEYFIGIYRYHKDEYYSERDEFYSIKIGGAKIAVVYDLRN